LFICVVATTPIYLEFHFCVDGEGADL
jgi:hypothetical protein